ncbi:MAG: prephenate dehydrogenase [Gemmatimonadetes bacterium]|nr:prephenate dehydrogenase [Gemmatimonadota bacterium]
MSEFAAVAVLGLGVMGGSLARALSALEVRPRVIGWSPRREEREAALEAGVVDEAPSEWRDAVRGADLVVLATPLGASCDLMAGVAEAASASATLSDVASLKAPLARAAAAAGVAERWVGCHPMAGSEEFGFGASSPDLYSGARVWTVACPAAADRVPQVHALWRSLGARPAEIDADEHDRLMARVSHLPQLTANALATVLMEANIRPEQMGPGGRDTTRLAGSNADLWKDLLEHASPELAKGLRELASTAERMADMLERKDVEDLADMMRTTRAWRQS